MPLLVRKTVFLVERELLAQRTRAQRVSAVIDQHKMPSPDFLVERRYTAVRGVGTRVIADAP
jgi:hypothetical protein